MNEMNETHVIHSRMLSPAETHRSRTHRALSEGATVFRPMARPKRIERQLALVESASLDSLIEGFPDEWATVGAALVEATAAKRAEAIEAFVRAAQEKAAPYRQRAQKSRKNPEVLATAMPYLVRSRMAYLAARRAVQAAALGSGSHHRFTLWNGLLVQKLFFAHGLQRKPVSMRAFRWLWPLVTQKRLLMPLVNPKGIYAFYSKELVAALAGTIANRPALEIAAGDGCLSCFLRAVGVPITATDDHSWARSINYPDDVEKLEADSALARYRPRVVLCSYPPPNNAFEAAVLASDFVECYVVITTRHRFAAGNWAAYEAQTGFDMTVDAELSRLILPPQIEPLLLVFRRKQS
jgi:hypothetical protein